MRKPPRRSAKENVGGKKVGPKGHGQQDDIHWVYMGYEMDARVSKYTSHEVDAEDHCVRCRDLIFTVVNESESFQVIGWEVFFRKIDSA